TPGARLIRFAKYNAAIGAVAIGGQTVLTGLLLAFTHAPAALANAFAVAALAAANYGVSDRWIWTSVPAGRDGGPVCGALIAAAVVVTLPARASAQPAPETLRAWDHYVAQQEARIDRERASSALSAAEPIGDTIDVPSGAIHHWRSAVFIPNVTLRRLL